MGNRITVNEQVVTTRETSYTISGSRTDGIVSVTVNGAPATLEPRSWRHQVSLSAGLNSFSIVGTTVDNENFIVQAEITVLQDLPILEKTWNSFDEYGLLLGIPRLLGESNRSYALRLLDEGKNRSGTTIQAASIGTSRLLGLQWIEGAVVVRAVKGVDNEFVASNPFVRVTSSQFVFTCDNLVFSDVFKVESSSGYININPEFPVHDESTIAIFDLNDNPVPIDRYSYYEDDELSQIRFKHKEDRGKWVKISYQYEVRAYLHKYTLGTLKSYLEGITDESGSSYLNIELNAPDSLKARKLVSSIPHRLIDDGDLRLHYVPMVFKELIDKEFRKLWYNEHAYGTKLESWARQVKIIGRVGWGEVILDADSWEHDVVSGGLPNLYDAVHTYWKNGKDKTIYRSNRYVYQGSRSFDGVRMERYGVPNKNWLSGVSGPDDLLPIDIVAVSET